MHEDIFILIESYRLDMTEVEQVIADYFLTKAAPQSMDKLAAKLAVSKASITRFCKKIGLDNYKELIFLYKLSLTKEGNACSVASQVTGAYHALATRSDHTYSQQSLDSFCHYLHQYKMIHFFGKGFNAYAGSDFQFKFSRFGKYVRVITDEKSILMSAHFTSKEELILVSSLRGKDESLLEAMKIAKKKQVPLLLVTANRNSQLLAYANVTLFAASLTKVESLGHISPQIPILLQLDMVYERYIRIYEDSIRNWLKAEQILHK